MTAPLTPLSASLPSNAPFIGPETIERARAQRFKARIGANESAFGPSPLAIEAMQKAASESWKYCDPTAYDLRCVLAAHHNIAPESIVIGEGIDALLGNTVRLFVGQGDKVVTSEGAYPTFNYHVTGFGGVLDKVPFRKDHEDIDALIKRAQQLRPKLLYFSNPDNPMGSWHSAERVSDLIDETPQGILLCLDEAYAEFAPDGTAPPLDPEDQRIIRFRTFSKAYGMAGLRIGYAICHPGIAAAFDRVRNHFGVSRIAQTAAIAAIEDQAHLAKVLDLTANARRKIAQIAQEIGLVPLASATNFVTVDCGKDGEYSHRILKALEARDVFVRMPGVAPLDRCIRFGVGTNQELDYLAKVLPDALSAAEA